MKSLWAPWRMEYIRSSKPVGETGCFLCVDKAHEEKALVVGRRGKAFVIMNKFPYANGHVMVVPERHVGRLEALTDEELLDMIGLVKICSTLLSRELDAEGLNVGINMGRAAGAGLEEHIHIHIVPRWFGDTNFMPILGETKVISEHLHETYKKLRASFLNTNLHSNIE
jgi:ATP adenylyltransferase